jgi:hypothetical protein
MDKGWIESTSVSDDGELSIRYSDLGKARMRTLKNIFIDELQVALTSDQFEALISLLLIFDKKPEGLPKTDGPGAP